MISKWASATFALLSLVLPVLISHPLHSSAQGVSLLVTPAQTIISANPGETKTVTINLSNAADKKNDFAVVFENFGTIGETGEPIVNNDPNLKGGLKSWLKGSATISLGAKASKEYKVTVTIPKDAAAGTYWGRVVLNNKTVVDSSSSSPIFVNVGAVTEKIAIESLLVDRLSLNPDGTTEYEFGARIKNTDNSYSVPKLTLAILDEGGAVVTEIDANNTGGILPQTTRKYAITFANPLDNTKVYRAKLTATTADGTAISGEVEFYKPLTAEPILNQKKTASKILLFVALPVILFIIIAAVIVVMHRRVKSHMALTTLSNAAVSTPGIPETLVQPLAPPESQYQTSESTYVPQPTLIVPDIEKPEFQGDESAPLEPEPELPPNDNLIHPD
ncbi:DUF916 domain-containing protein [Candidatus Saccharibacteria bacterium]|nr:DUF916 domain-containing protein [Candidatus Saccharibacteria bacterium]